MTKDEIEKRANALYDEVNPRADTVINVSKAACIKRVVRNSEPSK
jgi:hypothetical protein